MSGRDGQIASALRAPPSPNASCGTSGAGHRTEPPADRYWTSGTKADHRTCAHRGRMRLFSRGCESREAAYLVGADRLDARERVALEAHAASCVDCADALRNARPVDIALRGAFAPLRERRTTIAPGRVRLAVGPRSAAATNAWLRAPRFFARLVEVSVMV